MAIETLGAALRHIKRLFDEGRDLGAARWPAPRPLYRRARRSGLRGAGGAARADGPERLPGNLARPQRRRGRLPGHVPGPGQEGRARSGAATSWAAGCTRSRTASRSRPTTPRPGGAAAKGRRDRWLSATTRSGPAIADRAAAGLARGDRPAAGEVPAAGRALRPGGHDPAPRPPGNCTGANGRSAVGWPRRVLGSSAGWPAAGWRPTARCWAPCSCARRGPPCRRPGAKRRSARRSTSVNPTIDRRGRLGGGSVTRLRRCSRSCCVQKLKLATAALLGAGLMAWGASAALVSRGRRASEASATLVVAGRRRQSALGPQPEARPADAAGTFPVRGRVLDPDGKPVAGAGVYVRHYAERSLERDRPDGRAAEGACGGRLMRTAGSISSWTRVRAMSRTGAA